MIDNKPSLCTYVKYGLLLLIFIISLTESAEDQRCRCVCPLLEKSMAKNTTLPLMVKGQDYSKKVVYIKRNVQPEDCNCISIITYSLPDEVVFGIEDLGEFCLRCQCLFEQRNSTTQKVVIIFVIVVFGLMIIYGTFLMCLDPVMNKRRNQYARQMDEMNAELIDASEPEPGSSTQPVRSVTLAVNRVRKQQERWKGQVTEQRSNIYQKHNMLA